MGPGHSQSLNVMLKDLIIELGPRLRHSYWSGRQAMTRTTHSRSVARTWHLHSDGRLLVLSPRHSAAMPLGVVRPYCPGLVLESIPTLVSGEETQPSAGDSYFSTIDLQ